MTDILLPVIITGVIGLLSALLLTAAARFMAVKKDEKSENILKCLPNANCGGCGYAGCDGYASALAKGECAKTNLCSVGGDSVSAAIASILGVEKEKTSKKTAFVHCGGYCDKNPNKVHYNGLSACSAVKTVFGGEKKCVFGCFGLGDCMAVCPVDAVCIKDGIARIITHKCIGCGRCVKVCPNGIITLIPAEKPVRVRCSSPEKGIAVRQSCTAGCIGCKKCEKECPVNAITVMDNLSVIDYEKCISCGKCVSVCPTKCIVKI